MEISIRKILITAPLGKNARHRFEQLGEVIYDPWIDTAINEMTETTDASEINLSSLPSKVRICGPEEMAAKIKDTGADLLICESDLCSGPVFSSGVKIIAACREDPKNVDATGATEAGIPILYTPGRTADAVAEHTLALLFSLNQHLLPADRAVRAGTIYSNAPTPPKYRSQELLGKVFGIVGFGDVGNAVKWRAEALGMKTMVCDPYNPNAHSTLAEVLRTSDVISMHAPTLSETAQLMGELEFSMCKPNAIYLNTASFTLQDTQALCAALQSGHIAACGLDHIDGVPPEMLAMENVLVTPGISAASHNVEERQGDMIFEDIFRLLEGVPPIRILNPEVLASKDSSRNVNVRSVDANNVRAKNLEMKNVDVESANAAPSPATASNGSIRDNATNGSSGIDGVNGVSGVDGVNGVDGVDGVNGVNGANGAAEFNNSNGANGTNGTSFTGGTNGSAPDEATPENGKQTSYKMRKPAKWQGKK